MGEPDIAVAKKKAVKKHPVIADLLTFAVVDISLSTFAAERGSSIID